MFLRSILGSRSYRMALLVGLMLVFAQPGEGATNWVLVGWNNLGMHCMDSDYSIFSILPPYNTVNAQLIKRVDGGSPVLVTLTNGLRVTYEAVVDPAGSSNSTSVGKSNFRQYAGALFGVTPGPDEGLPVPGPAYAMPGSNNVPQAMGYEGTPWNWFVAYGVPLTPYDDNGMPNSYPLMRLKAETVAGTELAYTDVVLPVSDEMDCRLCHHSDRGPAAEPTAGWVHHVDPGRDYRLNILRLHDERQSSNAVYITALASNGLNAAGLYASVVEDGHPVLCAACHLSEALPNTGFGDIAPLTEAIHARHAAVLDPRNGLSLDATANRVGCYTCHPGSVTRCLRGAMGSAVAADGSRAMQCQSCHGSMSDVADSERAGWLDEPNCQSCHSGDALNNEGAIRFLSALTNGLPRTVTNQRFATNPDTPAPGHSLYRFSSGHGGLQCSTCHGSTHAIYPSASPNDNLQNEHIQQQAGTLGDCSACHGPLGNVENASSTGGPHGMHSVGQAWVEVHHDRVGNLDDCRVCHGTDLKGTVLSRALVDRTLTVSLDGGDRSLHLWKGFQVGCYACHDGPNEGDPSGNNQPSTTPIWLTTTSAIPASVVLAATDGDGPSASWHVVAQPDNGTVALSGSTATYHPGQGFSGTDAFTFAVWDGLIDSNLATATVTVVEVDTVGDEIPDWWRRLHFGGDGTTTNGQSTALADPDSDDYRNIEEFRSGTDPNDPWSVTRIFGLSANASQATLRFASWLGQRFGVERSEDLLTNDWTNIADSVWGRTDSVTLADPGAAGRTNLFYRTSQAHE
ncbi:MAG: hypothetical protein HQ523_16620 [Lentisphaerae bacterium]|nr:hypothetical protein [Lentisphaerota bacterium]